MRIFSHSRAKRLTAVTAACLLLTLFLLSACDSRPQDGLRQIAIAVRKLPDKTEYAAGESFDRAGMKVVAVYSDGSETEITAYNVHPSVLSEGTDRVFVSYKEASAEVRVTVRPKSDYSSDISVSLPDASSDLSPDEPSAPDESPDESSVPGESTDTSPSEGAFFKMLELIRTPVKTVYVSGEELDLTGLRLSFSSQDAYHLEVHPDAVPIGQVKTGGEARKIPVQVYYRDVPVQFEITVVPGEPDVFHSRYTESDAKRKLNEISAGVSGKTNNNFEQPDSIGRTLENPFPDGVVRNTDELTAYLDYHLFYGIDSVIVRTDYAFGDFEKELDAYYYRSGLCASNAAVSSRNLGGGWHQVLFRLYKDDLLIAKQDEAKISKFVSVPFFPSSRPSGYKFKKIDAVNGVTVWNSDQLSYALSMGYDVSPVPGSPAEEVLNSAASVLESVCDDGMTPFQKMYNIALYFIRNVRYDKEGEVFASHVCDFENEPDQLAARFVSFKAEGPLLYGHSVCYGFAKANTILLALEGLDVRRVVGKDRETKGRSAYLIDEETGQYEEIFYIHSYNYVTIDGKQYLDDITFAYAGDIPMENGRATWYRNPCVGLSKEEHAVVYNTYEDDIVSSSPGYSPGSFFHLEEFTYPSAHGDKPAVVRTQEDLEDWFAYMKTEAAGSKAVSAAVFVSVSFDSAENLVSRMQSIAGKTFPYYRYGLSKRVIGDEEFYELLLCAGA